MSETREILAGVIDSRSPAFADSVTNLRTGLVFLAELEEIADQELNTLLGRDPRESIIFHVRDRKAAADIGADGKTGEMIEVLGQKFIVVRRTDNPVSAQVDFGAMKWTENDT